MRNGQKYVLKLDFYKGILIIALSFVIFFWSVIGTVIQKSIYKNRGLIIIRSANVSRD